MKTYTVAEYAEQHGVSEASARRRLNALVTRGKATVISGVIIGARTRKRGARGETVPVRGNQYTIKGK